MRYAPSPAQFLSGLYDARYFGPLTPPALVADHAREQGCESGYIERVLALHRLRRHEYLTGDPF
jgi:hypothetical protein